MIDSRRQRTRGHVKNRAIAGAVFAAILSVPAAAKISAPTSVQVTAGKPVRLHDVMIPMRDGVRLATDIYLPSDDGVTPSAGRHPVLLLRTPYDKTLFAGRFPAFLPASAGNIDAVTATANGYVVAYQDVRGTFHSQGVFDPMMNEGPDGADTVAWLRRQAWADGRVGTFSASYNGGVQMLTAAEGPPGLITAFSQVAATDQFKNEWVYMDGTLALTSLQWTLQMLQGFHPPLSADQRRQLAADYKGLGLSSSAPMPEIFRAVATKLPLSAMPIAQNAPWWPRWLLNRDNRAYFKPNEMSGRFSGIRVPIYHLGGWYDLFLRNTLQDYLGASSQASTAAARAGQRLMIGPWSHNTCANCPPSAGVDGSALALAWMDREFKGKRNPLFDYPVILFVMGADRWRAEEAWPLPGTVRTKYYLRSGGRANTAEGDGELSTTSSAAEHPDIFAYDPRDPAPTLGGIGLFGSRAPQNEAEKRRDVLVYSTPILSRDVEVTGFVRATLYAASSATDTDWWMKLIDVAPDGKASILDQGVARARYRSSRTHPKPLRPGEIERYAIDMWATSNVFLKGHRIRLEVTSSNFPYADRNPNSFIDLNNATEKDFVVARQRVYHDTAHPSYVDLPIIPALRARRWLDTPFGQKPRAGAN